MDVPPRGRAPGIVPCGILVALLLAPGFPGFPGAAAPLASAQAGGGCVPAFVSVQDPPDRFAPGETATLIVTIENPNEREDVSVQAKLAVTSPPGWTASAAQGAFVMGPRNVTVDRLTITAPQRGTGAQGGQVDVRVTFVCAAGPLLFAPVHTDRSLEVRIQEFRLPWLVVGLTVLLAGSGAGLYYLLRGTKAGVSASCASPDKTVSPGKGASFPLVVANRRRQPDRIRLDVEEVPRGWSAFVALAEVDLEAKEERSLWLMIRAPPEAAEGDEVAVRVRATSATRPQDGTAVVVRARVDRRG